MNQKTFRCVATIFLTAFISLIPAGAQTFAGVLTQHNDTGRTGQNLQETILTPTNVNSTSFGKLFSYSVDGQMFAQPLYVPNVTIGATTHNVVYAVTQNDSVYAFDADGLQSTPLWSVNFLNPASGIGPVPCQVNGVAQVSCGVYPIYGITATPVIDPTTNTMYVLARTQQSGGGTAYQTLHALDITSGAEKFGGPMTITGSVPGTGGESVNGILPFDTLKDLQRAGLLLANGNVYIAWAGSYHGWVMSYSASTLQQLAIFNTTPNSVGGGTWQTGNGIIADSNGDIYLATGNGVFDANTGGVDYSDSVLHLDPNLNVVDYFTPLDQACRNTSDRDLASSGPMLLPPQPGNVANEIIQSGKGGLPCDTNPAASPIYVINADNMGKYNATQDQDVQEIAGAPNGYWSSGAYYQGASGANIYYAGQVAQGGKGDNLRQYSLTNGLLSTASVAKSVNVFPVGATPSVSANGNTNGIVWVVERPTPLGTSPGTGPAILWAYNATNVGNTLYSSATALSQGMLRDRGGCANKFAVPTIANGKVYVGTQNELDVFGLLGAQTGPSVYFGNPCWTFAASSIGTAVSEPLSIANNGNATLNLTGLTITGANAADFTTKTNCTRTLAPGKKCAIQVTFTATQIGPEWAYVNITDNAVGSPHNMYIVGVGQAASTK